MPDFPTINCSRLSSRVLNTAFIVAIAVPSISSVAWASGVHTSLSEFDACEPLRDGRVVAGSGGGLVIVDAAGREERRLTALDGLPGTKVHALAVAGDTLWVGTDLGLAKVSLASGHVDKTSIVTTKPIRDILIERDEVVVATWGQGLLRITDGKAQSIHLGATPRERRITSVERHGGDLWWTTAGAGLWHLGPDNAGMQSLDVARNTVLWALKSHDGALWIGGESGAMQLGAQQTTSRSIREFSVIDSGVHAASFGEGVQPIGTAKRITSPGDRFARSVGQRNKVACVGTQDALWIRRGSKWKSVRFNESLPANDIAAFVSDGERSFIGTFDQGVAELGADGSVRAVHKSGDPHVNALAIDAKSGALWIGSSTGLTRYHRGQTTHFNKATGLPSDHVMSLAALSAGGVLVGTATGAARVEDGLVHAVGGKGRLLTGNVWAVAQGHDGADWLGTTRGVFHIRDSVVTRYRVASGELPDDWVMALAVADDGVFVGTYKAGVIRLVMSGDEVIAKPLGKGWINPSGLHWDGTTLRAATMYGAFRGDGVNPAWQSTTQGLGRDTTAFQPTASGGEWIVTRRGLERRAYASESK